MMTSVDEIVLRIFIWNSILSLVVAFFLCLKNIFKYLMNLVGGFSFSKYPMIIFLPYKVSVILSSSEVIIHLNTAKYMKHTSTLLHIPSYAKYHQTQCYVFLKKVLLFNTRKFKHSQERVSLSPSFLLHNYFPGYKI